uniref:Uncharacterized protein n=1 Tax=Anopheles maculatus TaxID=74869 RepID=A0A182T6M1_9DIPT
MSDSKIEGILLTLWKPLIGIGFGVTGLYSVRFFCPCLPESFFVASKMLESPLSSTDKRLFSFNGFGGRVTTGGINFVGATDVIVSVVATVSLFSTLKASVRSSSWVVSVYELTIVSVTSVDVSEDPSSCIVDVSEGIAVDVITVDSSLSLILCVLVLISSVSRSVVSLNMVVPSVTIVEVTSASVVTAVVRSFNNAVDSVASVVVVVILESTVVGTFFSVVSANEFDTSVGFSFSNESDSRFWKSGSFTNSVGIFGNGLNMIGTGGIGFRTGKLKSGFSM